MNSSNPRLYTLLVIGEETLSSTSAFNLRQSEALSATTKAFIVKSFRARYLEISGANRTLAVLVADIKGDSAWICTYFEISAQHADSPQSAAY
jgi:hypothetical protein